MDAVMDVLNNAIKIISAGDVIVWWDCDRLGGYCASRIVLPQDEASRGDFVSKSGTTHTSGDASLPAGIEVRYEGKTVPRLTSLVLHFGTQVTFP